MKNILFIVKNFTFHNKNTSTSNDFLNSVSKNKYNTTILFEDHDINYINKINPNIIIYFLTNLSDTINYESIYKLNIPIYVFVEDTYYLSNNPNININGLIIWYKNNKAKESYKLLNNKLIIYNLDSRYVNTNIYKDYKLEKKYDILLYGSRSCMYCFKNHNVSIKEYYKKNNIPSDNDILFYPLRKKLETILINNQHRYNIRILSETSIMDESLKNVANENLSKLINQSYLTVSCSSIADVLFFKHLEIPASKSVILGSYPTEYSDLFKGNVIEVNEFMEDEEILNIIDEALKDKQKLLDMSETFYKKIHEDHNLTKACENFNEILDKIT